MNEAEQTPPTVDLETAYKQLLDNLWYAQHEYHLRCDSGREGAKIACRAVAQFLYVLDRNALLAAPFMGIFGALQDLNNNVTSELFAKTKTGATRSRSSLKRHFQVTASACLEVLVQLAVPLDQAAAQVARAADKWPGKGDQRVTATTVRNWRDKARAGTELERRPFNTMCRHMMRDQQPKIIVEQLLRSGPLGIPKS